jgi:hypothetical protein
MQDGQGDNRSKVLVELLKAKKIAENQHNGVLLLLLAFVIVQLEETRQKPDMPRNLE